MVQILTPGQVLDFRCISSDSKCKINKGKDK